MESSGHQTDQLILYGQSQARSASRSANAAAGFAGAAGLMQKNLGQAVTDFKIAADQSAAASQTAASNAERTLQNAQDSFREERRAWVGMAGEEITQFDQDGIGIKITFLNTGKSPARKVRFVSFPILASIEILGPPDDAIKILRNSDALFRQEPTIAPQGAAPVVVGSLGGTGWANDPKEASEALKILKDNFPKIQSGEMLLYVFGEMRYEDVSGRPHTTQYCVFISDPKNKKMGICPQFNEMD
jgi:type II secretory pathway pseudopilin PulG